MSEGGDGEGAKQEEASVAAAEALKEEGNALFKQGRYGEAVERYTRAIGDNCYLHIVRYLSYLSLFFTKKQKQVCVPGLLRISTTVLRRI